MQINVCSSNKFAYICLQQNDKTMTIKKNIWDIKVGDKITFTNKVGSFRSIEVARVENKSWYTPKGGRNSWNTFAQYLKYPDAKIHRS